STPLDWLSSVGTVPFLSDRRIAVIRHLLRRDPDNIKLTDLPETALLILVADDESGDDSKQMRYKTLRTNWEKAVNKAGGYMEDFEGESRDVPKAGRAGAEVLGKKLSDPAIDALVEMTGFSISRAIEELEKLAIFVGDTAEIRESDVRTVVVP